MFDHFVGLALKGLIEYSVWKLNCKRVIIFTRFMQGYFPTQTTIQLVILRSYWHLSVNSYGLCLNLSLFMIVALELILGTHIQQTFWWEWHRGITWQLWIRVFPIRIPLALLAAVWDSTLLWGFQWYLSQNK